MTISQRSGVVSAALLAVVLVGCGEGRTRSEARVEIAKELLSTETGVSVDAIEVVEVEEVTWPDSSLGCAQPGMMYAQGVVDGFRIVLSAEGIDYAVHGSDTDDPFICRQGGLVNGSFFAEIGDRKIHYEVHGQGPVVMVVPNSWGLDIVGLRGIFGGLEDKTTMVYFDPRGMGESDPAREEADMSMEAVRQDFDALRSFLDLETVHAIGWSNGAGNLILLAYEYPDSLESAIFVHGTASFTQEDAMEFAQRFPELVESSTALMQELRDPSLTEEERTASMKEMWLNEFLPLQLADRETGEALLEQALGEAQFSYAHGQVANRESMGFDMRDKLPAIPVRSLVIAGAHDMSPPDKVKVLADGLPDSVYVLFESSGHFAPLEEPELFESTVYEFLGVD